jgi:hypothetical protein
MTKRDRIYLLVWLCICLAAVLAFTAHRWGPAFDSWPDEPIMATAEVHLEVLERGRCK